jgi:excisionase family DNA binding protein
MSTTADLVFLTPPTVAKRLGVDAHRVLDWIRQGKLRAVNLGDGAVRPRYRVDPGDLQDFLDGRAVTPPSKPANRRRRDPNVIKFY